jgi:polyisoprenyl-phosphate glycosyltransferase
MNYPKISVVSPVYKAEIIVHELVNQLHEQLKLITNEYEIILINDASPDFSWEKIVQESLKDNRVKGLNLSRNFGQHYAITAGLNFAKGDWVVIIDCDLQDNPKEILKLYNKAIEGYEIVKARRCVRKDTILKRMGSNVFFKIYSFFIDSKFDNSVGNFAIYSRIVVESYLEIHERGQALVLFSDWLGFNQISVDVEHNTRFVGNSSYTIRKLVNLAIENIVSQSNKPLKLFIKFGFLLSAFSLFYGVYLMICKFLYKIPLGWTSIMVTIFFIGGLLFANLGIIGLYIGKIFDEVKNRPLYIIKNKIGF